MPRPSGAQSTDRKFPTARSNQRETTCQASRPGAICQIRTVRSRLAPASHLRSGEKASDTIQPSMFSSCSIAPSAARNWPGLHLLLPRARGFNTLTAWSPPPSASSSP
jgi:hypothetical protein